MARLELKCKNLWLNTLSVLCATTKRGTDCTMTHKTEYFSNYCTIFLQPAPGIFSNFSCMFLYPFFFSKSNMNCSNLLDMINPQEQIKIRILLPKIVLAIHCLNKLLSWSQDIFKFSAISLKFQKNLSITTTFFSHSKSDKFW